MKKILYLILNIITLGLFTLFIAKKLNLYEKDAWYTNWYYWVLGTILGIFPALIMLLILSIKMGTKISEKLNIPGKEIYSLPYPWIICLIIPILGWTIFIILYIYVHTFYTFKLDMV